VAHRTRCRAEVDDSEMDGLTSSLKSLKTADGGGTVFVESVRLLMTQRLTSNQAVHRTAPGTCSRARSTCRGRSVENTVGAPSRTGQAGRRTCSQSSLSRTWFQARTSRTTRRSRRRRTCGPRIAERTGCRRSAASDTSTCTRSEELSGGGSVPTLTHGAPHRSSAAHWPQEKPGQPESPQKAPSHWGVQPGTRVMLRPYGPTVLGE